MTDVYVFAAIAVLAAAFGVLEIAREVRTLRRDRVARALAEQRAQLQLASHPSGCICPQHRRRRQELLAGHISNTTTGGSTK